MYPNPEIVNPGVRSVCVTGGSGFIGTNLLQELQKYPVEVSIICRNKNSVKSLPAGVRVIESDLSRDLENPYIEFGRPDLVIHLAWEHLDDYHSASHLTIQLPTHFSFLQKMITGGLPALFVSGTCFEYGLQEGVLTEETQAEPVISYAKAKDSLHQKLQDLQKQTPFNLTWGRLFYMYGKGQGGKAIYSQLMQSIKAGTTEFNMSGGEQLRDYLPVEEMVSLLARLALASGNFGPVNLCSGKPQLLKELVAKWAASVNSGIRLNLGYYEYPDYEPMAFWGDCRKLNSLLG